MEDVKHSFIRTNGINMHIAERGSGPMVLLLHGFPSIWSMWRHQIAALAAAGYHVVAPDQRGYGQTEAPAAEDQYTILHMVGDVIGLLDALGEKQVLVVGHDWGSIIGWYLCQLRPDRVKGYVAVAVPVIPRGPGEATWEQQWRSILGDGFYICRFQCLTSAKLIERQELPGLSELPANLEIIKLFRSEVLDSRELVTCRSHCMNTVEPGRAERDFGSVGTSATLKAFICGFWDTRKGKRTIASNDSELSSIFLKEELPPWHTAEEHAYNVEMFEKSGFTGPLNWYRNFGRSYELLAPWVNCPISTKAYYITGEYNAINEFPGIQELVNGPAFKQLVPNLRSTAIIKDAAHFIPEEKPEEFNVKLLAFLTDLQSDV